MTIEEALRSAGIPRADAEVLLAHALQHDRAWLLAHGNETFDTAIFHTFVARRKQHEPVAYITGTKEFFGRAFHVEPGVLIPRPSTEGLMELTLDVLRGASTNETREIDTGIIAVSWIWGDIRDVHTVADIGTGSGCIAVTLACEEPTLRCIATDISIDALRIAKQNAEQQGVLQRITFAEGDGLTPLHTVHEPFIVVTNPPYIADASLIATETLQHEPSIALMGGGADGAKMMRSLLMQSQQHPFCRGIVAECLSSQGSIFSPA